MEITSVTQTQCMGKIYKSLALIGLMSSYTRHRFLFYQVKCKAQIDMSLYSVLCWVLLASSI
jgi:hypothetical protein